MHFELLLSLNNQNKLQVFYEQMKIVSKFVHKTIIFFHLLRIFTLMKLTKHFVKLLERNQRQQKRLVSKTIQTFCCLKLEWNNEMSQKLPWGYYRKINNLQRFFMLVNVFCILCWWKFNDRWFVVQQKSQKNWFYDIEKRSFETCMKDVEEDPPRFQAKQVQS